VLFRSVEIAMNANNNGIAAFTCLGSNDGNNWTQLYTVSGLTLSDYPNKVHVAQFGSGSRMGNLAASVSGADIKVYPVPAHDVIYIEGTQVLEVSVLDASGKQVKVKDGGEKVEVDLSSLVEGVYLLKINTINGYEIRRFVKN